MHRYGIEAFSSESLFRTSCGMDSDSREENASKERDL
jgi:hypothetical protein